MTVRMVFLQRTYQWSKARIAREFVSGFPLLRVYDARLADRAVDAVARRGPQEQEALIAALAKSAHAAQVIGVEHTQEEVRQARGFVRYLLEPRNSDIASPDTGREGPGRRLTQVAKQRLTAEFGVSPAHRGGGLWAWETRICEWKVRTHMDRGGSFALTYRHSVGAEHGPPLISNACILGMLGLPGGDWQHVRPDEVDAVVDSLTYLCHEFMAAAKEWLDELSPQAYQMEETGVAVEGNVIQLRAGVVVRCEAPVVVVRQYGHVFVALLGPHGEISDSRNLVGFLENGSVLWQINSITVGAGDGGFCLIGRSEEEAQVLAWGLPDDRGGHIIAVLNPETGRKLRLEYMRKDLRIQRLDR